MHNESPPIILSNYRDSNLFQTAVLGQVKERQFIQIDLRIPLKKKRTRLTHKGRVHDLPLDLVVALFSYSHRKGKHRKTMGETTFPWTWRKGYLFFHTYWWSIIHVYLFFYLFLRHSAPKHTETDHLLGTNRCCFTAWGDREQSSGIRVFVHMYN